MAGHIVKGQVKTPFARLNVGIVIGYACLMAGLMVPSVLLLALKMHDVDPAHYTTSYGLIVGIGAFCALIGNPVGGAISDRTNVSFGRRRTWILLGPLLGSLAIVFIGFSSEVWQVLVGWCIAQVFFNFGMASFNALIPDQVDEEKQGTVSGLLSVSMLMGIAVGFVLINVMGALPDYLLWVAIAIFGFIGPAISTFIIRDGKVEITKQSEEKSRLLEKLTRVYPNPRKYPSYTWAIFFKFMTMMALSNSVYLTVMLIKRMGLSDSEATNSVTIMTLITLVTAGLFGILGGVFSDKIGKQKPFLYSSCIVVIFGTLIFAFIPDMTAYYIGATVLGIATGCFTAVDKALVARILPRKEDAAKDFGLMNVANTLPQSIVPAIAPVLLAIGSWEFFYGFLACCAVIGLLAIYPVPDINKDNPEKSLD